MKPVLHLSREIYDELSKQQMADLAKRYEVVVAKNSYSNGGGVMLAPIEFPARMPSRLARWYKAVESFHTNHHMAAWFCWLGVLSVVLVLSAVIARPA